MPRKLGWKYEYWNGQAHISPRHHIVTTTIEVKEYPVNSPYKLRPVEMSDEPQLVSLYIDAFGDTIDFCDWEPGKIANTAGDDIHGFFAGKRGRPLPASRAGIDNQSDAVVVGAALIVEREGGQPFLDMLFVDPEWQRKGVAEALVSTVINELYSTGSKTLKSHYHLGNEASRAWHQRFGFVEELDLLLAELYYHHARHEFLRREKIGDLTEVEHKGFISEIERWKAKVEELEEIAG
jgi:GNAT superfamily N-acetyltransferase